MAKLVAFYSRADENYFSGGYRYVTVGNTEKVAKIISELTGADLFKIEQKIPYYWGDMPMAVYTFLEQFDWNGKTVHPFCTHEGSGLSGTEGKIQSACKGAVVTKGLALQGSFVDTAGDIISKWI